MDNIKKCLQDIVGIEGFSTLRKAIFKRGSQSVLDPAEFMLPLIVAPRALLSWLVQNIRPLEIGGHKTLDFPGRSDIKMWVQKQDHDVYRGEFVQNGKIIQTFDKQSLPTVAMTLMTTGEMYDGMESSGDKEPSDVLSMDRQDAIKEHERLINILKYGSKGDRQEEAQEQESELDDYRTGNEDPVDNDSSGVVKYILDMNDINIHVHHNSPSADSVPGDQLSGVVKVVGNLIDALVGRNLESNRVVSRIIDPMVDTDDYEGDPVDLLDETDTEMDDKDTTVSEKAEMPSGAAAPKAPSAPKLPVPPATKQVMASAQGKSAVKPTAQASVKKPTLQPAKPMQKDDMGFTGASGYFRKKLGKVSQVQKKEITVLHDNIAQKCTHCGTAEFKKNENGEIVFSPCACFLVEKTDRFNREDFVTVSKNENGSYNLSFATDADQESVQAFLLTLKARLLVEQTLNKRSK